MLYRTASIPILGTYKSSGKFSKCAAANDDISKNEDAVIKRSINLIAKDILKAVSSVYNISDDINDYIFPIPRAVSSDIPNSNGDRFAHEELTRFSNKHRCMVFQTFRNDPLHVEHVASDPKAARGFLPDSYYVQDDPKDRHVIVIAAVDTTKDSPLAEGILKGDIDSFSMGCICDQVQCSICGKKANSDRELCDCLLHHKMSKIAGKLVYEDCLGVEYQELSVVGQPADETARTQAILQLAANSRGYSLSPTGVSAIASMVTPQDQLEIARFFQGNLNKLPEAMLRLAHKLF